MRSWHLVAETVVIGTNRVPCTSKRYNVTVWSATYARGFDLTHSRNPHSPTRVGPASSCGEPGGTRTKCGCRLRPVTRGFASERTSHQRWLNESSSPDGYVPPGNCCFRGDGCQCFGPAQRHLRPDYGHTDRIMRLPLPARSCRLGPGRRCRLRLRLRTVVGHGL